MLMMKARISKFFTLFLFGFSVFLFAQKSYNIHIYEGNKAFDSKNYERASSSYSSAAKINAKDFTAHYNLGNAFYKRKMYDEAKAEYTKAKDLAKNKNDRMAALYNLGNVEMESNNHDKAAELYKEALKWDPYNENARRNYQIAKLKDKEQQQGKGGGGNGGKEGKDPQQESDENGKGQEQGGQGNQQNGQGNQGNNPDPNKNQNQAGNMPKDLEDAIMKRVEGQEKETARKILNKNSYSVPQSKEKDW